MPVETLGLFKSEFEARAVCARLEAEGLHPRMNRQGRYRAMTGGVAVEVDGREAVIARKILGDLNAPVDLDEYVDRDDPGYRRCPACGSANVDMTPLGGGQTLAAVLTLGAALFFIPRACSCRKCGHGWNA